MGDWIYLLEPNADVCALCSEALSGLDLAAQEVSSVKELLELLVEGPSALAILDLGAVGLTGVAEVRSRFPDTDIIVLAENGTIAQATEVMRYGAFDYLPKPLVEEEIVLAVRRWLQRRDLVAEKERLSEIIYLLELGRTLTSTLELEELHDQIILQVARAFLPDTVSLMLLDEKRERLVMVAQRGLPPRAVLDTEVALENSIGGQVVREERPLLLLGGLEGTPYELLARGGAIGSAMSIPLTVQRRTIGVLNVTRRRGRANYTERDAQLLHIFASQIAIALQNAQLYESLRQERDRIIKAQEDVRRELARDLHDGLIQVLAASVVIVDHTRSLLDQGRLDNDALIEQLDYLRQTARQAVRDARALSFGLRPLVLETKGLLAALEQYLEQIRESDPKTHYHLMAETLDRHLELQPQVARVIFAIFQEAINNARKHARAQNVWVSLRCDLEAGLLHSTVEDDGAGFDLPRVEETYDQRYSFGLLNMRERAELIGGSLRIESALTQGTRIELVVPWYEAQA
ncbi:MAG: GAF domain-containing protein [Ardenticatenaceae bacterium]|nr:GAF domain-containing protein [Ardenticatenaceae bacterium]HBY97036.1 hypothetical protein [Chloroflexota bacterium]